MTLNVTVTPAARRFIQRMVRFSGQPAGAGFRLEAIPGGCSGVQSSFSVEPAPARGDEIVLLDDTTLFVSGASLALLDGATIDFADTPTQSGLVFALAGPPACACGSNAAAPAGVVKIDVRSIRVR